MDTIRNPSYIGSLLAGLVIVARLCYLWMLPKPILNIPHDPITSISGHIPDLVRFLKDTGEKDNAKWFDSITAKHGPLSQVLLGRARMVIIADRVEVERLLLRGKSTELSRWVTESFGTVLPTGQIGLRTNDVWKRHRQLTGPSMSRRYVERMSIRVSAGANNLVRLWARKVDLVGGKAFAADQDLKLAAMDVMLSITMGDSPSAVDIAYDSLPKSSSLLHSSKGFIDIPQASSPPLQQAINILMKSIEQLSFAPLPVSISKVFIQNLRPSWRESRKMTTEYVDNKIIEARAQESQTSRLKQGDALATDADCVVDMIAQREAREGAEKFDIGELRDELMTFIIAGQDTTGVVLSWLVKFLSQDMVIQRQLHDEVCAAFGPKSDDNEPWDFNIITDPERVPIVEAIVAESLRCARTAPNIARELLEDEVILGRHVPKGTQLLIPVSALSAQESDWGPDAKSWRPSRWLRSDGSFDPSAGPNLPFGMGQRACFGQRLAMLKLKTFVAALSRAFIFKPVPEEVAGYKAFIKITRQPEQCYVSLERWPMD